MQIYNMQLHAGTLTLMLFNGTAPGLKHLREMGAFPWQCLPREIHV